MRGICTVGAGGSKGVKRVLTIRNGRHSARLSEASVRLADEGGVIREHPSDTWAPLHVLSLIARCFIRATGLRFIRAMERQNAKASRIAMPSSRSPAVSPGMNGFQCGPLPAASGSFARNDHNGGVTVVGLF